MKIENVQAFFEDYLATLEKVDELEASLRTSRDWDAWCAALEERASFFHGEYRRMSEKIRDIVAQFNDPNITLDESVWKQLQTSLREFYLSDAHDLALVNEAAAPLLRHYERTDDLEARSAACLYLGYANLEYSRIVRKGYGEKAAMYYKKLADMWVNYGEIDSMAVHQAIVVAMVNLTMTCVCLRNISVEEGYYYWECMKKLQASEGFLKYRNQEESVARLLDMYIERYKTDAFAIAITSKEPFDPELRQKLIEITEKAYISRAKLLEWTPEVFNAYISEMDFAFERGQITANDCWRGLHQFYYATHDRLDYDNIDVISYYQTCLVSMIGYLDATTLPQEEKLRHFQGYQDEIRRFINEYTERNADVYTLNSSLTELAFLPAMYKFFQTQEEKIDFLFRMVIVRHCTTFLHSLMVSAFAEVILGAMIDRAPELLIGYRGFQTAEEVRAHREELMTFIKNAALLHDVGKNAMLTIIETQYRPLTDAEFGIIREHPTMGAEFLNIDPDLAKFKDITNGHHKFYNGKGGYPASFDNTASPERIMIDVITLCDCMDAATDCYGRNYRTAKTTDQVLEEFRTDGGVRYNPDIVKLMVDTPEVVQELREIAGPRRLSIYYNTYQKYFM